VVIAGLRITSPAIAGLAGLVVMVAVGCVDARTAFRVDWRVVIMIGALLTLGLAMEKSGVGALLAQGVIPLVGVVGPRGVLCVLMIATVLLSVPMSNQAAALIMLPVGIHAALDMGLEPRAFAMGICLAASYSFLTPLEPSAALVYGPGRNTFLQPSTILLLEDVGAEPVPIKRAPERFRADGLVSEQLESTSTDGTRIPYFIVHKKDMPLDGSNPTVLYGYGGFLASQPPSYLGIIGKTWLERGGVYVIANIRGGGEFGPEWHRAALKENRQRAFDDFASVARDLIARKMTSPRHLGIHGGSNGGLLVGTTFTQHPELFNAVVCQVPLLDMMRYHHLLAGASWMEEYGNPDDPKLGPSIRAYSPYQNLKKDVKYPEVFFTTSTKDDRVHPGHARKMAARMEEQGHPFFYYENIEGGHGGTANTEQRIKMNSLVWTYFDLQLR
jgi:acetyl esterase/lipase